MISFEGVSVCSWKREMYLSSFNISIAFSEPFVKANSGKDSVRTSGVSELDYIYIVLYS